ncbi:MAG: hypothetical protein ACE5FU_12755 [Nitrospinota bacterium]
MYILFFGRLFDLFVTLVSALFAACTVPLLISETLPWGVEMPLSMLVGSAAGIFAAFFFLPFNIMFNTMFHAMPAGMIGAMIGISSPSLLLRTGWTIILAFLIWLILLVADEYYYRKGEEIDE